MSDSLSIRPVEDGDLPSFFEFQADARSHRLAGVPPRDRETFDAHWARIRADETCVLRTIVADGTVVGSVVSFLRDGVREVGYWIGRAYWGRGYASQALALFLAEYGERPLHARVVKHNAASRRVLEKNGFRVVGEGEWTPVPGEPEVAEWLFTLER